MWWFVAFPAMQLPAYAGCRRLSMSFTDEPHLTMCHSPSVTFVNPLEVDGFAEPGGWGFHEDASSLPLLVFLPGMDGSLATPFMQYAELSTTFELSCLQHVQGLKSRASFDELTAECADAIADVAHAGRRQVLLVGESFGATLALAVAHELQERHGSVPGLRGVVPRWAPMPPSCAATQSENTPLWPQVLL
jgi:pimeloyl-ACP methyl ester carboxylesterase